MNGRAAGVTCKGPKSDKGTTHSGRCFWYLTSRLACDTRGRHLPWERRGWEAIFLLLSLSRSQGFKAQAPDSFSQPPSMLRSHSLCFFLCFFFFFFFFAALLSFDVCLALLPVSLSESELSESDDFLSLCFFFFFSWKKKKKKKLRTQHYMCVFALKKHGM